jgi:hypothetical protein
MANGNLRLARVLNLLLLHLNSRPAPVSGPELSNWESAACHALRVLAASWDNLDEQALEQALNQLESLNVDQPSGSGSDNAWVFTQLARASTELSAMIVDVFPGRLSLHSSQA